MAVDVGRIIREAGPPKGIAGGIMSEASLCEDAILERLAEREVKMKAVILADAGRVKRLLHCGNVVVAEADRLQIGKAPPDLAQRRLDRKRSPVGGDAFGLVSNRFQDVAVAHP